MRGFWQDLRYGLRLLLKSPGFTVVAVLSLALGIGANTTVFSFVNALLLRPFPVAEPERLVTIHTSRTGMQFGRSSYPDYTDVRDRVEAFSGVLARSYFPVSVKGSGKPEVVLGNLVSSNYFDVLGVKAHLGRTFLPEEGASEGSDPVVVLSHRLWKRSFDSDPRIVGKRALVNSYPFTVIGVAPEGFAGVMAGFATDVWVQITMASRVFPADIDLHERGGGWLDMVGRLKDGVEAGEAQAAVGTLAANLRQEYPDSNESKGLTVVGGVASRFAVAEMGQGLATFASVLMGVVGLVLLIACSNVASLLLVRAGRREQEIAMRLALGAGRGRIIRQLLTESILLSVLAGAAGLLFAVWTIELLGVVDPPSPIPVSLDVTLDGRVLGYTLLLSMLAGVIFGLAPAMRASGLRLYAVVHDRKNGSVRRLWKSRLQSCLVAGQVALSLVLLVGAGLCLRSLRAALTTDPGFEVRHGLIVGLNLAYGNYREADGRVFYRRLIDRVKQLRGVRSASLAVWVPLSYVRQTAEVSIEGYEPREGESLLVENNSVGPAYFETLGIPILQGRAIDERDRQDTEPVLVINETMARRFWGRESPVGRTVTLYGKKHRVVGVAKDGKYFQLSERQQPFFYRPLSQGYSAFTSLHVKTAGDPRGLVTPVLREVEALDPNLPVYDVKTLDEHMGLSQYPAMMTGILVGGVGFLALALAMVGVFGVMSYTVSQRTHEFGIRAALGAQRGEILKLVLHKGVRIAFAGVGVGLAGAFAATRVLSSLLFKVSALDPAIFAGVSAALTAVALLACYIPARRAAKVDPMTALRYE